MATFLAWPKRRLDDGTVAVFATNLFGSKKYRRRALCDLYCYRWDLETAFAEMKVWHGLENFNARYTDGIHQEVAALMTFMLLSAELEAVAREHYNLEVEGDPEAAPAEPVFRFNRKQIAECVGHLLVAGAQGEEAFEMEFKQCMRDLWLYRQRRKPGRKFERTAKSLNSKWKRSTYNVKSTKKSKK